MADLTKTWGGRGDFIRAGVLNVVSDGMIQRSARCYRCCSNLQSSGMQIIIGYGLGHSADGGILAAVDVFLRSDNSLDVYLFYANNVAACCSVLLMFECDVAVHS